MKRKRGEEKRKENKSKGMDSSKELCMELYGTCVELWFCMESCVFWTLIEISMVFKLRV